MPLIGVLSILLKADRISYRLLYAGDEDVGILQSSGLSRSGF